jgi:hypothetical protein
MKNTFNNANAGVGKVTDIAIILPITNGPGPIYP